MTTPSTLFGLTPEQAEGLRGYMETLSAIGAMERMIADDASLTEPRWKNQARSSIRQQRALIESCARGDDAIHVGVRFALAQAGCVPRVAAIDAAIRSWK